MTVYFTDEEREAYRQSKDQDYPKLPDGDYVGIFENVQAKVIGQKREKRLILSYSILKPEQFAGVTYNQFVPLDNKKAYGILKAIQKKFGLNPDEIELDNVADEMIKVCAKYPEVHFTLFTKTYDSGEYQNAKISAVVENKQSNNNSNVVDNDDIPF